MNYTKDKLKETTKFKFPIHATGHYMLVWNDDDDQQPEKRLVTGMQIGPKPWITTAALQDGDWDFYWQHAAEIPEDWTPYQEPKEIPFFDAEVGKKYRVVGNCGMDFDRIMFCVKKNEEGCPLFGDSMDDKKCIGTAWIHHIYTC